MKLPINKIICGAMPEATKGIPDGSINCCISSPPYWALRDYSACDCTIEVLNPARTTAGPIKCTGGRQPDPNCPKCGGTGKDIEVEKKQLGLEPTFEEYIDKLCTIYDEVKRVLRDDGTCWVNLGDTYSGAAAGNTGKCDNAWQRPCRTEAHRANKPQTAIKDKSLCLIPQRFAIEMVNRGWILRNVIIWHKPNPMPSSAKDRFTVDFEYVYFFVKNNQNLWYFRPDGKVSDRQPDYKNGTEGLDWYWGIRKKKRVKLSLWQGFKYWFEPQYEPYILPMNRWGGIYTDGNVPGSKYLKEDIDPAQLTQRPRSMRPNALGRNKRTVWTIPTQPFPEAHFATFPEKLVEPMIKAGCPEFVCTKCGKARGKIYDIPKPPEECYTISNLPDDGLIQSGQRRDGVFRGSGQKVQNWINENPKKFIGYTDCGCNADWRPGIVWDCFLRVGNLFTGSCQVAA